LRENYSCVSEVAPASEAGRMTGARESYNARF
jgi:hypothetical protein